MSFEAPVKEGWWWRKRRTDVYEIR